jgi:hypothetical protein
MYLPQKQTVPFFKKNKKKTLLKEAFFLLKKIKFLTPGQDCLLETLPKRDKNK